MSVLNTNKLTWFGDSGQPLSLGYVYVGQPGLDPLVTDNQKTVTLTDPLGNSFTATQPLRTDTNGRVQYNGKPIIATVDGDYSLLVLNSAKVQITGGWTPTVTADSGGGGSVDLDNYRRYGLLLADIKAVDVAVGNTIGNVGKLVTTDGLGANWFVVSNTGGTADDIDLIDFDNGLQGSRIIANPERARSDLQLGELFEVFSEDDGRYLDSGESISFTSDNGWHLVEISASSLTPQSSRDGILIYNMWQIDETYGSTNGREIAISSNSSGTTQIRNISSSVYIYKVYKIG